MPSQTANVVDLINRTISLAEISWDGGKITQIQRLGDENSAHAYLIPGFVDAHVHIESAMLVPSEFARIALKHGTLAAVADPHEIANVLGEAGIDFMLEDAAQTPFYYLFGAPSCVPATPFETAGAEFDAASIEKLFKEKKAGYLSEMMNYPGVLHNQKSVMEKISVAKRFGMTIDGHAPGLTAGLAAKYAHAGIETDHECTSLDEALDKIRAGMIILIRDGSAANDFEKLHSLISDFPERVMFCSDDKHPD
ncbi:MAG TPA: amidohydrolase family protein, partial [Pseudomonadales bacterium]|nr:amidohydrolase family protein [Pseudomonadales bacterium]